VPHCPGVRDRVALVIEKAQVAAYDVIVLDRKGEAAAMRVVTNRGERRSEGGRRLVGQQAPRWASGDAQPFSRQGVRDVDHLGQCLPLSVPRRRIGQVEDLDGHHMTNPQLGIDNVLDAAIAPSLIELAHRNSDVIDAGRRPEVDVLLEGRRATGKTVNRNAWMHQAHLPWDEI
jgi:hypothetical protein